MEGDSDVTSQVHSTLQFTKQTYSFSGWSVNCPKESCWSINCPKDRGCYPRCTHKGIDLQTSDLGQG